MIDDCVQLYIPACNIKNGFKYIIYGANETELFPQIVQKKIMSGQFC